LQGMCGGRATGASTANGANLCRIMHTVVRDLRLTTEVTTQVLERKRSSP